MQRVSQRLLAARRAPGPPEERPSSTAKLELDHRVDPRVDPAAAPPARPPHRPGLPTHRTEQNLNEKKTSMQLLTN